MKNIFSAIFCTCMMIALVGCNMPTVKPTNNNPSVSLMILNPGHFHSALIQKGNIEGVDTNVYVYAPQGPDLKSYLDLVAQYNTRVENPTHWNEIVYSGNDFAGKMMNDKKGNVVILSGNNLLKAKYMLNAVDSGFNVFADKPMAINTSDFDSLLKSFDEAKRKKVMLYDIMTERSEITNILLKELSQDKNIFGELKDGSDKDPSIEMLSVHYFFKKVSGKNLIRPAWFFDPNQQGEPIADVGTHIVDLVQWVCFPERSIDYKKDIQLNSARLWPTPISSTQFSQVTGLDTFPAFLLPYLKKGNLQTHANGEINYAINGKHIKVTALWKYQAETGGDSFEAMLRGTKAKLVIRQGKEEQFVPTLYILPEKQVDKNRYNDSLIQGLAILEKKYPGISIVPSGNAYKVEIPKNYNVGHEAHFSQVLEHFLGYMKNKNMPDWEIPGMIAKYYITTKAVEIASRN